MSAPAGKFAVGMFFSHRFPFTATIAPYLKHIGEVYFPWPGISSARTLFGDAERLRETVRIELTRCRRAGLKLDLLFNSTCYGETAGTYEQKSLILGELHKMERLGILPEIVTTTSPFIASIVKAEFPDIDLRASVNMRINSTLAMEYVAEYFDSYYICRDLQRDFETLSIFSDWCGKHGKKLCMLVNSGCLRNCPWQTFHETMIAHETKEVVSRQGCCPPILCAANFMKGNLVEFLKGSWVRPEDLHLFDPYVATFKLTTRQTGRPDKILRAYTSGSYRGDLFDIIDPGFPTLEHEYALENSAFPEDWALSGVAGRCATNCTHCGKCEAVLKKVLRKTTPSPRRREALTLSFSTKFKLQDVPNITQKGQK